MRYEDWDVLLFPADSRAPFKEFKAVCHVVKDPEFSEAQGSYGLPTVCCFTPSHDGGAPFQVSVHSWQTPTISQVTRAYSKHPEDAKFEIRVFVDGRLTMTTFFDRKCAWPCVVGSSMDFSKNGERLPLRFPAFRDEILRQSFWDPTDEMNRIRIIISEGFLRDSLSTPFERVKNLVAFSFQHAPLDILESSGIAWPNPSMWQRSPSTSSMPAQTYTSPITESHAHSPRRQLEPLFTPPALTTTRSKFPMIGNSPETSSRGENRATDRMFARESRQHRSTDGSMDWIAEPASSSTPQSSFQTAIQALRKARMSNTDESMPDYVSRFEEPEKPTAPDQSDEDCCFKHPKAPSNTPADTSDPSNPDSVDDSGFSIFHPNMSIPMDLANSLTCSLLKQPPPYKVQNSASPFPAPEIKSRKETRLQHNELRPSMLDTAVTSAPSVEQQCEQPHDLRKVSQQMYIPSGASLPTTIPPMQTTGHPPGKSRNTSETAERTASIGEFGASTNSSEVALRAVSGNSAGKGDRGSRDFTPVSSKHSKKVDEEDERRLASPRVRLTPFIENADGSP